MAPAGDGRSGCRRDGGTGRGAERGQGTGGGDGRGVRRRLRDGSGRGRRAAVAPASSRPVAANDAVAPADQEAATRAATGSPSGALAVATHRLARLDEPDLCIGCGICVDACPPSAIRMDEIAVIQANVCTGCGECVDACPRGALSLVEA